MYLVTDNGFCGNTAEEANCVGAGLARQKVTLRREVRAAIGIQAGYYAAVGSAVTRTKSGTGADAFADVSNAMLSPLLVRIYFDIASRLSLDEVEVVDILNRPQVVKALCVPMASAPWSRVGMSHLADLMRVVRERRRQIEIERQRRTKTKKKGKVVAEALPPLPALDTYCEGAPAERLADSSIGEPRCDDLDLKQIDVLGELDEDLMSNRLNNVCACEGTYARLKDYQAALDWYRDGQDSIVRCTNALNVALHKVFREGTSDLSTLQSMRRQLSQVRIFVDGLASGGPLLSSISLSDELLDTLLPRNDQRPQYASSYRCGEGAVRSFVQQCLVDLVACRADAPAVAEKVVTSAACPVTP